MSKIGRKPIDIKDIEVQLKNNEIHYKGTKAAGVYVLPDEFEAVIDGDRLFIKCPKITSKNKKFWGLHRVLISNALEGAQKGFSRAVLITGLGYKGVLSGKKIVFSLGFSHKIDYKIPDDISIKIDKTGQKITVSGVDKQKVGFVCSQFRALRPVEPYKGTGIKYENEVVFRKVGKKTA